MELKVITNPIDQAGPARRLLSNLFYGWGYNFYRRGSDLRVDDRLIRGKLSQLLQDSRAHLVLLQATYLRKHLQPGQDCAHPAAVRMVIALERAQTELQAMEVAVLTAVAREDDRLRRDRRDGDCTPAKLVAMDGEALLALVTLRDAIVRFSDGRMAAVGIDSLLQASDFAALWGRRQALLSAAAAAAEAVKWRHEPDGFPTAASGCPE